MGEDPERLERDIERTRAKLGEDLDALEEKVNPRKVAHRSVDRAKEKAAEVREKVTARLNSSSPDGTGPGVGDKVSDLAGTARQKVAPLAATARQRVAPLAASAKEKAALRSGLDPDTADTREVATAVATGTWASLLEQTRRNPLAVGAAAFAVGLVLGHR
ncbi:MAG TPA: DUF3618 domain-containing protein [Mycobacteriales bacterium]|nr:DUF3618 domain-containing protein [Mycobacteriales bacterium]